MDQPPPDLEDFLKIMGADEYHGQGHMAIGNGMNRSLGHHLFML